MVIPKLEKLSLTSDDVAMIFDEQFPRDLFCNVKVLRLLTYKDKSLLLSIRFLQCFRKLEKLHVADRNLKELFPSERDADGQENCVGTQLHIRELNLESLYNLRHICNQDSRGADLILQNLKILKVEFCYCLISLTASTVPFHNLTTLDVQHCKGLRNLVSFSTAQSLVQLETMSITDCDSLTEVVGDKRDGLEDEIIFMKLKVLKLMRLRKLTSFCSRLNFTFNFPCLERLVVSECLNMETFCKGVLKTPMLQRISLNDYAEGRLVGYAGLSHLKLSELPKLMEIWNKNPQDILNFQSIVSLEICNCDNLRYVLTPSMVLSLSSLQSLWVRNCEMIEQIITEEEVIEVPENKMIFRKLGTLALESCPNLVSFVVGSYKLEFPSLFSIEMANCPKMVSFSTFPKVQEKETTVGGSEERPDIPTEPFFTDQVFPKLEKLSLTRDDVAMIFDDQFPRDLFCNVKVLHLLTYKDKSLLLSIRFLQCFRKLEKLHVADGDLEELFPSEGDADGQENCVGTQLHIRELNLEFYDNLRHICNQDSRGADLILQNLKILKVNFCSCLVSLTASTVPFHNLTTLDVRHCEGLRNLVSCSTAQSLVQLETMSIAYCNSLTEVVGDERDGLEDEIIFMKLKVLKLMQLTKLTSFCSRLNFAFKFPCLERLVVSTCPNMETFCKGGLKTPMLQRISLNDYNEYDERRLVGELNSTINQLYEEMVAYAELSRLKSSELPKLMEIWNKNPQDILDFQRIFSLEICNWDSLRYLFTPSMVLSLSGLWEIRVQNCEMLEQIITEEEVIEVPGNKMIFPELRTLALKSCPNLVSFVEGSYKLEFPSLFSIDMDNCPKMVSFSTFSIMREKETTVGGSEERLSIPTEPFFSDQVEFANPLFLTLSSMNVQQIFQKLLSTMPSVVRSLEGLTLKGLTEGLVEEERMLFPKLESVQLESLPKLKRFSSGYYLAFPSLTKLVVEKCPLLESFISSSITTNQKANERVEENNLEDYVHTYTPPLFSTKVVFPNLKELFISQMGSLIKIWDEQLDEDSFHKLYLLHVNHCEKLLTIFPINMVGKLQNLGEMQICGCESLEEILEPQGLDAGESEAQITAQSALVETTPNFVFPKVKSLDLRWLPNLKSFYTQIHTTEWPSLKKLDMTGCDKVQILASEILRTSGENQLEIQTEHPLFWVNKATFPNLEELIVEQNGDLKEIWHGDDDVRNDIIFTKLKSLQLKCLPRLASFCLGNCNFEFSSLKDVIVMGCPNMMTFTGGEVSTPNLQKVKFTEDECVECWEGGLNPTLQQLFTEKVGYAVVEHLTLSQFLELMGIRSKKPQEILSFRWLCSLEICNCGDLRYLLTLSMALSVVSLKKMKVQNCELLEQVISEEGANLKDSIVFTKLNSLELKGLPRLEGFCLGNCNFEFTSLEDVIVMTCPYMMTFAGGEVSTPKLHKVKLTGDDEDEGCWEGGLNPTVQLLFTKRVLVTLKKIEIYAL
ncbi:hypothetical protein SLEP1_g14184 [Rubroshorea leprosula]|uniref:Disease resistance protein At4g27190-like leucine-rich repeats domain-containing protein n=1 Tax=Rubroshorea leprosula TaxID=152421 RepID=A0AAV5IMP6_9ROSI|nr:hypothetical protein SLEP1_g14184 [Rubroshorea leprosula]